MTVSELREYINGLSDEYDNYQVMVGDGHVANIDDEENAFRRDLPISTIMLSRPGEDIEKELWLGHIEPNELEAFMEIVATWGTMRFVKHA